MSHAISESTMLGPADPAQPVCRTDAASVATFQVPVACILSCPEHSFRAQVSWGLLVAATDSGTEDTRLYCSSAHATFDMIDLGVGAMHVPFPKLAAYYGVPESQRVVPQELRECGDSAVLTLPVVICTVRRCGLLRMLCLLCLL